MLILLTTSCSESKKESAKSKYEIRLEKQKALDSLNQLESSNLVSRFNALTNPDNSVKFTYQLQENAKNNKPILFTGFIRDIISTDNNYILKVYGVFGNQDFFIEILTSPEQFNEIKKRLDSELDSYDDEGSFIVKLTSIRSSSLLEIDSDYTTNETEENLEDNSNDASSQLTYNYNVLLLLKGQLLDFHINKKLKKDNE